MLQDVTSIVMFERIVSTWSNLKVGHDTYIPIGVAGSCHLRTVSAYLPRSETTT